MLPGLTLDCVESLVHELFVVPAFLSHPRCERSCRLACVSQAHSICVVERTPIRAPPLPLPLMTVHSGFGAVSSSASSPDSSSCPSSCTRYFSRLTGLQLLCFLLLSLGCAGANFYNVIHNWRKYQQAQSNPVSSASTRPYTVGEYPMLWAVCVPDQPPDTALVLSARCLTTVTYPGVWVPCSQVQTGSCITIDVEHLVTDVGEGNAFILVTASGFNTTQIPSSYASFWVLPWPAHLPLDLDLVRSSPFGKPAVIGNDFGNYTMVSALSSELTMRDFSGLSDGAQDAGVEVAYDLINQGQFVVPSILPPLVQGVALWVNIGTFQRYIDVFTFYYTFTLSDVLTAVFSIFTFTVSALFFVFPMDAQGAGTHDSYFRCRLAMGTPSPKADQKLNETNGLQWQPLGDFA